MKKVNWDKITQHNLSKDCFWANHQSNHPNPVEKDVFNGLTEHFSLPNIVEAPTGKSDISLRVLGDKAALNLLITLRGLLKNSSHEQIKQYILHCDTNILNTFVVEALIKHLPNPNAMKELKEMIDKGVELPDIEKFVASLCGFERLVPHLHCIYFMLTYNDMVESLEPDIRAGSAACNEIISSEKFGGILKLILRVGNHMNSGSNIGGATGFDLTVLTKLNDVKSVDSKQTLLNYIVQTIEKLYPELLTFDYEMEQVGRAARINVQAIEETIRELAKSSMMLQDELNSGNDYLTEAMSAFSNQSRQQIENITMLFNEMKNDYQKMAKYYAIDISRISMVECFTIIQTFIDSFAKERTQCSPKQNKPDEVPKKKGLLIVDINKLIN